MTERSSSNLAGVSRFRAEGVLRGEVVEGERLRERLRRSRWEDLRLVDCDLRDVDLRGSTITRTTLERCDLQGARLDETCLKAVRFTGCSLEGSIWRGSQLTEVVFESCRGTGLVFRGAALQRVQFNACTPPEAFPVGRSKRGRRAVRHILLTLMAAVALALAARWIDRLASDPRRWTRDELSQKIDKALQEGRPEWALELTRRGIERWSDDAFFRQALAFREGDILIEMGRREEALAAYRRVLVDPESDRTLFRAAFQKLRNRWKDEEKWGSLLEGLRSQVADPVNRARIDEALGDRLAGDDPAAALQYFRHAHEAFEGEIPDEYRVARKICRMLLASGRREEAWSLLTRVIWRSPVAADRIRGYLFALRQFPARIPEIRQELETFDVAALPDPSALGDQLVALGSELSRLGEPELALGIFSDLREAISDPARMENLEGLQLRLLEQIGELDRALALARELAQRYPLQSDLGLTARLTEARLLARSGRSEEAARLLERLLGQGGDRGRCFDAAMQLADLQREEGRRAEAEALLRRLQEQPGLLDVQRWEIQIKLAYVLEDSGRTAQAKELFAEVAEKARDRGQIAHAYEALAQIARNEGEVPAAIRFYRLIGRRLKGVRWAEDMSLWGVADVYEEAGKPEKALEALEQLVSRSKDPSRVAWSLFRIARCARALGDEERARDAESRLLREFPRSEPAKIVERRRSSSSQ
jgi:tetratricopeptide (TPR) repeat protein